MTFATLGEAIAWTRYRWDRQRPVPLRIHEAHSVDGELGGLRYTGAFLSAISSSHDQTETVIERTACAHPGKMPGRLCPMCVIHDAQGRPLAETGVYERQVDRYRYPMTRALARLANAIPPRRSYPHPRRCIDELAAHGWDARATAASLSLPWDLAEALFLRSLRQLHGRYEETPPPGRTVERPSWIELSESQRSAITAGEGLPAA